MKMSDQSTQYYPVFLNISGRRCIVVGGGQVARRKVGTLLEHGANITVISPELCPELDQLAENGEIEVRQQGYREGDLAGAFVVIAATDDGAINQLVVREARERGILINVVDDADNSDFIAPSVVRRGDITIAISTAGRSPALARKLRTKVEEDFSDEYASLVNLVGEVRTEVRQRGIPVDNERWQEALDLDLLIGLLRQGEAGKAKSMLLNNLKGTNNN